ncbi:MAG: nucleoside triphosphate pyrophosphohydrolase [Syntrophorhabdaceae bacterium]|nr:nucleoside triphosphate pyrophosphohydrolase [Syntrophorhabdaceae bacterium]
MDGFRKLTDIMARLRSKGGCEWDRAQTRDTLRQYLLEETYEVIDAIHKQDSALLKEELGDLLFQILFHAQIADERGEFNIHDVIVSITDKMVRRHPHVFGDARADNPQAVALQWEHIKQTQENRTHSSIIGGIPKSFPSLLRAAKVSKKASGAGFDWDSPEHVLEKLDEELLELKEAMAGKRKDHIEHEIGDVLLTLANLARFLDMNPELLLTMANNRFEQRFQEMEKIAEKSGICIKESNMETLNRLWELAKKQSS